MKPTLLKITTTFTLLFLLSAGFAQAPNLRTAANFEFFTTVGAISNTGISQVTGDVGSNSGAVTGFGNVNGNMQVPANGATGQAAADLLIAYDSLASAIPTFFPSPALGNGDTLRAGVYHITGVTSVNGILYLDGNGDGNAVFIFQIEAAFSTGAGAKIKLIGGAQACNVFWKIEDVVSLAPNTSFKGTIVSHSARIDLNANDTLEGRALALGGAINPSGVLAYIPAGCGFPVPAGPASPNLGVAGCFAVFSSNGFVNNFGISHATGDIGSNTQNPSGWDQLLVNGIVHLVPDGATTACKNALLNAYTYINLLPVDITLKFPPQFGNNLVLTPHTYLLDAATQLTDTVYLNALNQPNAVFVIQINGALTTSPNARVKLINGAQAKNVFWKVEGAISISDHSVINGTLIANNGAIDLATADSVNGRVLTTTGLLTTSAVVVTIPAGTCGALPITWLSFSAEKSGAAILVKWATANEVNNDHFEVQSSTDGVHFNVIGTVAAGISGSSAQDYSYTDYSAVNGNNFYRLKQIDRDAEYKYSSIAEVTLSNALWSVFPNPATSKTTIHVSTTVSNVSIILADNTGRTVYRIALPSINAGEAIDIPLSNLTKGIYILHVNSDKGSNVNKIIIQ